MVIDAGEEEDGEELVTFLSQQGITMDYPKLSYDSLARITMNQLLLYLEKQGVDIRDYTYYTGTEFPEKRKRRLFRGEYQT